MDPSAPRGLIASIKARFQRPSRQVILPIFCAALGLVGCCIAEYSTWKYGGAYWQRWSVMWVEWEEHNRADLEGRVGPRPQKQEHPTLDANLTFWGFWRLVGGLTAISAGFTAILCALAWRTMLAIAFSILAMVIVLRTVTLWSILF